VLMVRDQGSLRIQLPGQRVLAELLAVTRESVGRSLDELGSLGLITRIGRGMVEVDTAALSSWLLSKKML
jgi:DNA-binding FadR family transcriptional regulator